MYSQQCTFSFHRLSRVFILTLLLAGCDSGDAGDETLEGEYEMVSLTDKTGQLTGSFESYDANVPANVTITENGQSISAEVTVSGSLTLSEGNYSLLVESAITTGQDGGTTTETIRISQSGPWSETNGRISLEGNSSESIELNTLDYLLDGNRLFLEDGNFRFLFEK